MELHIRFDRTQDLARQIYRQIREAIVSGRPARGDRLPPTRELARRLDVSRNTVSVAYEWLVAEGLLSGRKGAGSFVEGDVLATPVSRRAAVAIRHRTVWDTFDFPPPPTPKRRFDFGVGMPDGASFPYDA